MPAAARISDMHTCPKVEPGPVPHVGGPILPAGCVTVLIGGLPAARVGDKLLCVGPPDTIAKGSSSVIIGNMPAARLGDPTEHGGVIVVGLPAVDIGESGSSSPAVSEAASSLLGWLSGEAIDLWRSLFGERYSDGIVIKGNKEYRDKVRARLDELNATPSGRKIIDTIDVQGREGKGVTIESAKPGDNHCLATGTWQNAKPKDAALDSKTGRIDVRVPGEGTTSTVGFNPDYEPTYADGKSCRSPAIGLGHELIHASHNGSGTNLAGYTDYTDTQVPKGSNHEEAQTIGRGAYAGDVPTDNSLRQEIGYKPRTSHASVCP